MRLIDADKLLAEIKTLPIMSNWGEAFFPQLVQEQQTIDAVPVVRCKDCKYGALDNSTESDGIKIRCNVLGGFIMNVDDYCSCGERKDD